MNNEPGVVSATIELDLLPPGSPGGLLSLASSFDRVGYTKLARYLRSCADAMRARPTASATDSADRNAYEGAREDLLDWKGRAQRAEATLRTFGYTGIDASEPPAGGGDAERARDFFKLWFFRDIPQEARHKLLFGDGRATSLGAHATHSHESALLDDLIRRLASGGRARAGAPLVLLPVLAEIERATRKFPTWPTDPLHALGVVGEEFGELGKAVLQAVYEPHKSGRAQVRDEAIQTAAMAIRFVASLDAYNYNGSAQHRQSDIANERLAVESVAGPAGC